MLTQIDKRQIKHNRFEKHPKKILVGVFIASLFFAVFIAEILLSLITQEEQLITEVRNIRLREHPPSLITYAIPTDVYMNGVDSLVQKEFRFENDKDGYIYPSRIHKQPDMTIFFLGGSTTEAIYVDEYNRFPYLVGRLLEGNGIKVNSINSGVSGNNSMHSINILLNKGLALRPDIAIMMHNVNDLNVLLYENNYWNKNPNRSLLIVSNSNISNYLKRILKAVIPNLYISLRRVKRNIFREDEFVHLRGKKLTINKQGIIEKFERSLLTFIAICKSNGIIPILMTQANRFREKPDRIIINNWTLDKDFGIKYEEYKNIFDSMNDLIREVGRSNMVLIIDLAKDVPQDKAYMYDILHYNDNGSKYVARLIVDQLNNMFNKSQIN